MSIEQISFMNQDLSTNSSAIHYHYIKCTVHLCALYCFVTDVTVLESLFIVLIGLTIQGCEATDQVSDIFSASTHPISRCLF
jgi:hypothetical protein